MLTVLKAFLFIISNIGFWECLRRKTDVHISFLPSLTIALQVTILFLAGLLNVLRETAYLTFAAGILYCIYVSWKEKNLSWLKHYVDISYLFCLIVMAGMLFFVWDKSFTHYDDFSHWALVVKRMLETNRYPNFEDPLVSFTEYPLGSSTYIYYFAKFVNQTEPAQMLAQIFMMTASMMPFFSVCKKNKAFSLIIALAFANFFYSYSVSTTSLLVDTLLPLVSVCSLFYVYRYCTEPSNKASFFLAGAYLLQVTQIKNSGLFFVVIEAAWILIQGFHRKGWLSRLILAVVPFTSFFLWHRHCRQVFSASANITKHAMTVANFQSVFGAKTQEDISCITKLMIHFAFTWKDVWMTFAMLLLTGILIFIFYREYRKKWCFLARLLTGIYIAYQIGMLGMYLFSMPIAEASDLAGCDRYTKTILVAILYVCAALLIAMASAEKSKKFQAGTVTAAVLLGLALYQFISLGEVRSATKYMDDASTRQFVEQNCADYQVEKGKSYGFLIPENDGGYIYYLARYLLESDSVSVQTISNESDLDKIGGEYIFLMDSSNPWIRQWVEQYYPDQTDDSVIKIDFGNE